MSTMDIFLGRWLICIYCEGLVELWDIHTDAFACRSSGDNTHDPPLSAVLCLRQLLRGDSACLSSIVCLDEDEKSLILMIVLWALYRHLRSYVEGVLTCFHVRTVIPSAHFGALRYQQQRVLLVSISSVPSQFLRPLAFFLSALFIHLPSSRYSHSRMHYTSWTGRRVNNGEWILQDLMKKNWWVSYSLSAHSERILFCMSVERDDRRAVLDPPTYPLRQSPHHRTFHTCIFGLFMHEQFHESGHLKHLFARAHPCARTSRYSRLSRDHVQRRLLRRPRDSTDVNDDDKAPFYAGQQRTPLQTHLNLIPRIRRASWTLPLSRRSFHLLLPIPAVHYTTPPLRLHTSSRHVRPPPRRSPHGDAHQRPCDR